METPYCLTVGTEMLSRMNRLARSRLGYSLAVEIRAREITCSPQRGQQATTCPAVAASSRSRAQCRGAPALSSSTAIAFANLCWSPVVHCMRIRAAVAAQYKFRLVGTVLALHSSLARAQLLLPISRAISCHRCHLPT